MVYNESVYTPTDLNERLRAKFSTRTAAIRRNSVNTSGDNVVSFFGRTEEKTADRAMPKAAVKNPARAASRTAQPVRRTARPAPARKPAVPSAQIAASFSKAYAVGEGARNVAGRCQTPPRPNVHRRQIPEGVLRRGRSNIPGSRHAVVVTDTDYTEQNSGFLSKVKSAFKKSNQRAEHEMKKERVPFGLIAVLIVCTVLVMALIYSFSRVQYYTQENGRLEARQVELSAEASKLALLLEERDDIRQIEKIATDEIGMVRSDTIRSRFVSVSTPDRVEVMNSEDETGGGVAGILSAIGENFGRLGDYFG